MRHLIYILVLLIFVACSTKTQHNENVKIKFCNGIITDSVLNKIPVITYSKFEINQAVNQNINQKYTSLNKSQLDFFFTQKEQKELSDYFGEFRTYFFGKKILSNEKLAIFLICDADYIGIFQECAIINSEGILIGKFRTADQELDAGFSFQGKGEFLNDSTYQFSIVNFEYIDTDHKKAIQDSIVKIIEIGTKSIETKHEIKFPTDTILYILNTGI